MTYLSVHSIELDYFIKILLLVISEVGADKDIPSQEGKCDKTISLWKPHSGCVSVLNLHLGKL